MTQVFFTLPDMIKNQLVEWLTSRYKINKLRCRQGHVKLNFRMNGDIDTGKKAVQ